MALYLSWMALGQPQHGGLAARCVGRPAPAQGALLATLEERARECACSHPCEWRSGRAALRGRLLEFEGAVIQCSICF